MPEESGVSIHRFLDDHAGEDRDKAAYVMAGTGKSVSYGELVDRSRRAARLMRSLGAERGSCIAILMENHVRFFELAWAAQRAGLRYTAISSRLTVDEIDYILQDSGARLLFASLATAGAARAASASAEMPTLPIVVDKVTPGTEHYEDLLSAQAPFPLEDEAEGVDFLYSSGTTGRPKAIKTELPLNPIGTAPPIVPLFERLYGFGTDTVYLSPAPLYHSAPLRFNMAVQRLGGTSIVMDRFEPAQALALIERYGVTHVQMVPTMFVRLLRLSEEERRRWDLSSLRAVIHAAAPCPAEIKARMIDWLGPIVYEYYSATEIYLLTAIDSEEWLAHRGSVGRALVGTPHVLDDEGNELAPGEAGTLWSEGGPQFEYHSAPEKTAEARNESGWTTVGDVGYVDEHGYVYLTDRRVDMIISGGVNIYPQEAENALIEHPLVADAAVFGIPHDELGEEVKAVVEIVDSDRPLVEVEAELIAFCQGRLAKYKCPRSVDFVDELPRHPTGKLYKRILRDQYAQHATTTVLGGE
ncbi:MAG TPA: AMP-binding protein [Solirubrobacteraceae bacterium]|jgi:fatty-acyl-CoA synthase|nr:AMP-binding protein [Solirubrobacteraceae bacterium]